MNLDLSKFKKIKDDKHSATFKHLQDQHEIRVAKNVLSPKMRNEISSAPLHLEDGGAVQAKSEGMAEERARSAAGYEPQFPDVGGQQPTIIINNGPQPNQGAVPAVQNNPSLDYLHGGPFGSDFDMNKFNLQNPAAPVSSKMEAIKNMDVEEKAKQAPLEHQAFAQKQEEQNQQQKRAEAIAYNQMAASRGLPPLPVPEAPAVQSPVPAQAEMPSEAPPQGAPQAPRGPNDPYGTEAYYNAYNQGLQEQKGGIEEAAKAESDLAQAQQPILQQAVQRQQEQIKNYENNYSALDKERQAFQKDIQDKHIDPQHYMNSLGVAGRVSTAIGLILGGMGGGITGQGNPALDYLNKQIANDIDAQKANIGKTENLLAANMKQFGNLQDATKMTQLMQIDIVKNQLAEAAAKSTDPLVKARAQQAMGQLDMQAAPIMSQMAMRRTLLGGMQSGQMDPSQVIRMIVPEGQQQAAYKEFGEAQSMSRAKDNILSAFDQLDKINTVGNRVTSPLQSVKQTKAIRDPLIAQLSKETAGRFTEADSQFLGTLFPAPGDSKETIDTKRNAILKLVTEKMNFPMLQSYGIKLGNSSTEQSRYGERGQKKIQLAPPVAPSKKSPMSQVAQEK